MFVYCGYEYIVAKLISLKISHFIKCLKCQLYLACPVKVYTAMCSYYIWLM
jgi:hypothetical protein